MKRNVLILLVILLALTTIGARRRSVGALRACAALKAENVFVKYAGSLSGCASGNATQCQIGETISFELSAQGYDPRCGEHQVAMRFGDAKTDSRTTVGQFPSFEHAYQSAGGYALEATVSNGHSSVKATQMIMVASGDDDDDVY